ncbi:MAG: DUF2306 domain-containing protein [Pirellulaceae bacterium]|nr:DUF2306 domain-containing protein [Pirellulaceae bacterium]
MTDVKSLIAGLITRRISESVATTAPMNVSVMKSQASKTTSFYLTPGRVMKFTFGLVIVSIGLLILTPFPNYLPPDFDRGFLRNKAEFFYPSGYFIGFYAHILTAPVALLIGTMQLSSTVRTHSPRLHRNLGRIYVALALLGVAPGGLVMAMRSYGGISSVICFGLISISLWVTTWIGWRRARAMRFREHAQWMCRSYTLMCSAIFLRMISFGFSHLNMDHTFAYQLSAWLSWVPAMLILEAFLSRQNPTPVRI